MAGRPTKLTPERQRKLLEYIGAGVHLETACRASGIGYSTLYGWIQRGQKAKRGIYREFAKALERTEADMEATLVAQWRLAMHKPENWQAIRDFLERRFSDRWGRRDRIDVNLIGSAVEQMRKELAGLGIELTDEEAERWKALAVAEAEKITKGGKRNV